MDRVKEKGGNFGVINGIGRVGETEVEMSCGGVGRG